MLWQRCLDYELGQLHAVAQMFQRIEGRDARDLLPEVLPKRIAFESNRQFLRKTLTAELELRAVGPEIVEKSEEAARNAPSLAYRAQLNLSGSPSESVARGYRWRPGGEIASPPTLDINPGEGLAAQPFGLRYTFLGTPCPYTTAQFYWDGAPLETPVTRAPKVKSSSSARIPIAILLSMSAAGCAIRAPRLVSPI